MLEGLALVTLIVVLICSLLDLACKVGLIKGQDQILSIAPPDWVMPLEQPASYAPEEVEYEADLVTSMEQLVAVVNERSRCGWELEWREYDNKDGEMLLMFSRPYATAEDYDEYQSPVFEEVPETVTVGNSETGETVEVPIGANGEGVITEDQARALGLKERKISIVEGGEPRPIETVSGIEVEEDPEPLVTAAERFGPGEVRSIGTLPSGLNPGTEFYEQPRD
jgi:hypothetical protein